MGQATHSPAVHALAFTIRGKRLEHASQVTVGHGLPVGIGKPTPDFVDHGAGGIDGDIGEGEHGLLVFPVGVPPAILAQVVLRRALGLAVGADPDAVPRAAHERFALAFGKLQDEPCVGDDTLADVIRHLAAARLGENVGGLVRRGGIFHFLEESVVAEDIEGREFEGEFGGIGDKMRTTAVVANADLEALCKAGKDNLGCCQRLHESSRF